MKFLIKNKKIFSLILVLALGFLIFGPMAIAAEKDAEPSVVGSIIGGIAGGALLKISSGISYLMGAFFGILIYLEALIIDYLLSPTNFAFTQARVVQLGWNISRDLANMFFILILLIIAFATVLRVESYAAQQLLWKVVVAALLINFSLVIAGFVIDFTQILTTFFIKQAVGGDFASITEKLASGMQITNFYNPAPSSTIAAGITQFGASSLAAFLGIVLTLVGLVVTAFVFGATAIFLVVRILFLWFLLIVAPIAWILWILPATSGQFKKWWDEFFKWSFFAPIYAFMIYLSLSIFDASGKIKSDTFSGAAPAGWDTSAAIGGLTTALPSAIFQWILVIGMMVGALIVAQKFGVMGANMSYGTLKGWGEGTRNWAGRQLRRQALAVGAKEAAPGVEARPGILIRGAQRLAGVPLGGRILANQVFRMQAAGIGISEAQKQFGNWTPEAIQNYLGTPALFPEQKLGAALALQAKGKLEKVGEPQIKELAALASRYAPEKVVDILKVAPHLSTNFNKKVKEVMAKIETDKTHEIMTASLGHAQVVMNLNPQQLKTIVQKASEEKITVLKRTVDLEFNALDPALKNRIESEIIGAANKDARNKALGRLAEDEQAGIIPAGTSKIARTKFTTSSPAWEI